MNYFELDKNEKDILEDFEKGNFKKSSVKNSPRYKEYARETLNKSKSINIRISSKDLLKLKAKAIEKGIPYQTLVSSILHRYSSEKAESLR